MRQPPLKTGPETKVCTPHLPLLTAYTAQPYGNGRPPRIAVQLAVAGVARGDGSLANLGAPALSWLVRFPLCLGLDAAAGSMRGNWNCHSIFGAGGIRTSAFAEIPRYLLTRAWWETRGTMAILVHKKERTCSTAQQK